jgi:uncharacterized protein (TIGR02453 family)
MINKSTLKFLKDLKLNNSKEWLNDNKKSYENAKNDILTLTSELISSVSNIDKKISNAYLDPKKCITNYYIVLNKIGKNSASAFYYLHIEPNNCFVGGGVYNPQPDQLKKIRQEIDYAFDEWTTIIKDKTFTKTYPSGINNSGVLTRTPKEFNEKSPASEFLKMKGFYTMEKLTDKEIISADTFDKINSYFKSTKPLVDFLNRAIEND